MVTAHARESTSHVRLSWKGIWYFTLPILILGFGLLGGWTATRAETTTPEATPGIVGMSVKEGQQKLESMGYEIVYAKGKTQYWWNEKEKTCLNLSIKSKKIEKVETIVDGECESRLEAARKVWEAFADGQADIHSPELDKERSRLAADGYAVSYWAKNLDADHVNSSEYWFNSSANKCMYLVFRTADGKFLSKDKCPVDRCKNPAPKH